MHPIKGSLLWVMALLVELTLPVSLSAGSLAVPLGSLGAAKSGNDLILSFPTVSPNLYTVQSSPDLRQPWTNVPAAIPGDGSVKLLTLSNALAAQQGFYRLLVQTPTRLQLPQSNAFAVLGHSCGGIKEQVYVTGFDPSTGDVNGQVYLSTTCSTGGRGSTPATYTAWAAVTWDLGGNVVFSGALSNGVAVNSTLVATDSYNDTVFNASTAAYLAVPIPAAPTGVSAVQSGDEFQVTWTPQGINPAAVMSSTLTARPVNPTAAMLTSTVTGSAATGVIASLQPQTTYQVTVVNTSLSGSSAASAPISVTTVAASVPPSAPTGVAAKWTNLNPTGTTDTLVATWQAAVPGDSPIDAYLVTIKGSDGGGTFTQTVSGATLTASFTVDYIPNWSVTVQAHNAVGWGPASNPVTLGGL